MTAQGNTFYNVLGLGYPKLQYFVFFSNDCSPMVEIHIRLGKQGLSPFLTIVSAIRFITAALTFGLVEIRK